MRYLVGFILFSFVLIPVGFCQQVVNSEITEVVTFSDQALVTRQAETNVIKGLNELQIDVDAYQVDSDSIQLSIYGKGEINSVQLRQIYLKIEPQEKVNILTKKLEDLNDKKLSWLKESDVLGKQEKFLNSLIDFAQTQVPEDIKTSFPNSKDLKEALSFLSDGYSEINQRAIVLAQELRELEKEIKVVEKELASLRRPNQKTKKVIEVAFNSLVNQKITIDATYLVQGAYWQPFYKVNVPLELKKINLTMFSQIIQKTGEDWKDVKLAISNVMPLKGSDIPSLGSWLLDLTSYKKQDVLSLARTTNFQFEGLAEKGFAGDEMGAAPYEREEEAKFVQAVQKELPLSFEYQLPQKVSIDSQNKETTLPLFSKTLKGDFFHYSVPKVSSLVFLTSRITPDKELLPGLLNVYFAGRFVGKTQLAEKKAGEKFDINLGADRQVIVKREKLKDKIQETFFKKIQRQTIIRNLAFKITVENRKDKAVKLHLVDAIPVSKTDRIEVKDIKISLKPNKENYQDQEGLKLWIIDLKPGEKKDIDIDFTVTYPKDAPVSGL
ncbi:MAG: DUF4139 domain-containing protein [Candidatus Omnitrophica bacterium]|nr:DUF4139 domain-containing protein [Candidatus Omnitrophota bacterium]